MTNNKPNNLYKTLVWAFTLSSFSESIILPIYAIFVQKVGGDVLDAGWAMGLFLVCEGLFTILFHRLKWNRKKSVFIMVMGWTIWLFGIILYLFISNIFMLFITQIFTALGNAIADPIVDQELSKHTDKKIEEYEWGFFEGSKSLIDGLAAIMGGIIVKFFGFNILIAIMIATATASLILISLYPKKLKNYQLQK